MRDEWFYINKWNLNRQKIWAVIDVDGNIIEDNLDRYTAENISQEMNIDFENKLKTEVVHKHSSAYNDFMESKRRVVSENNTDKRGS